MTAPETSVREVRRRLGMSQKEFAIRFRLSLSTIRKWEQGTRTPEGPANLLLTVIAFAPDVASDALNKRVVD